MIDLEKTLYDLCAPLAENTQTLKVKDMSVPDTREILLYVYADGSDIARLIGRKGAIASALRSMMSAASRKMHTRVMVKFESYE